MSLKLNSSGGGSITLQEPSTASNRTLTLPDNTGNLISSADSGTVTQGMIATGVAGKGPAFSAVPNGTQSISNTTETKIIFASEEFDVTNAYDTSTGRFTPSVAGYYAVSAAVYLASANALNLYIRKNGSNVKSFGIDVSGNTLQKINLNCMIYLNGSTDYIELYVWQASGGTLTVTNNTQWNWFQAYLARAA